MRDHDDVPSSEPTDAATAPLDRTGQGGPAGLEDMLGGMSAGAGDRLGPDDLDTTPGMLPNQHNFADVTLPVDVDLDEPASPDPA